jgi:hypothetical protein
MEIERIGRYKDKLNIISERAQDIEEWVRGYDSSDFKEAIEKWLRSNL